MPARSAEAKQAQNLIRAAPALPVGGLGPDTVHSEARQEVLGGRTCWRTEIYFGFTPCHSFHLFSYFVESFFLTFLIFKWPNFELTKTASAANCSIGPFFCHFHWLSVVHFGRRFILYWILIAWHKRCLSQAYLCGFKQTQMELMVPVPPGIYGPFTAHRQPQQLTKIVIFLSFLFDLNCFLGTCRGRGTQS